MPSTRKELHNLTDSPGILKSYFLASRPKTWIASTSPVLIGTKMALSMDWAVFGLTLLFSLLIQIGTNYANDYFDFIHGADTQLRNGPKRATLEGWISPKNMLFAFSFVFGLAFCVGLPLMQKAGAWGICIGLSCILFGIFYTAGPKPLGYLGLGELLVFLYFGPVAVVGTYFLQTGRIPFSVFLMSLSPSFLSCAILCANNLRDETSDRLAKKKTLVVRFGKTFGAIEYTFCLVAALVPPLLLLTPSKSLLLLPPFLIAPPLIKKVFSFKDPLELISILEKTALILILYTVCFCLFV